MTIQTNLIRRGATYYFRARVPADLIIRFGRSEIKRSLGTTAVSVARTRGARARALAEDLFGQIRGAPLLTEDEIARMVRGFYANMLDEALVWRLISDQVDGGGETLEAQITGRRDLEKRILHDLARGKTSLVDAEADAMLLELGCTDVVSDGPKGPDGRVRTVIHDEVSYLSLCRSLLRALLEATRTAIAEDEGDFTYTPRDPIIAAPARPQPPAAPAAPAGAVPEGPSIASLVEPFIREKAQSAKVSAKTQADYRASLALFLQGMGADTPITSVTARQVVAFKDQLLKCPTNFRKRLGTDRLDEAIRLNEARPEAERLDPLDAKTINEKYLSNLKTFFGWAMTNHHIKDSPAAAVRAEQPKRAAADERHPFNPADLNAIFGAHAFTGCRSARRRFEAGDFRPRDHYFWAPLIALFSGCRLNEIGQLTVADVVSLHDMPHFAITDAGDDQRVKSEAGRRMIPVHPELIRIGFLDYVNGIGAGRLFPDWAMGADGYYSSSFSKWFSRFLTAVGVKTDKKSFHSFRHSFKDALRAARLDDRAQDLFMGHDDGSVQRRYGSGAPIREESEDFLRIAYNGLDLSRLRR